LPAEAVRATWRVMTGGYLAERDYGGGTFSGRRQKKPVSPLRSLSISCDRKHDAP